MARSSHVPQRYSVALFYMLAFAFTWAGAIPLAAYSWGRFPFRTPLFDFLSVGGPTLAAVVVTYLLSGRDGPGRLFAALFRWRVGTIWYAVALLGPAVLTLAAIGVGVLFGKRAPNLAQFGGWAALLPFLLNRLVITVWEEVGWRGFALPRLQTRYTAFVASLIVGVLWALWHVPLFWLKDTPLAHLPFAAFFLDTVAMAVWLTWLYNTSEGSLLIVALAHAATNTVRYPVLLVAPDYHWLQIAVMVLVAGIVVIVFGPEHLSRRQRIQQ